MLASTGDPCTFPVACAWTCICFRAPKTNQPVEPFEKVGPRAFFRWQTADPRPGRLRSGTRRSPGGRCSSEAALACRTPPPPRANSGNPPETPAGGSSLNFLEWVSRQTKGKHKSSASICLVVWIGFSEVFQGWLPVDLLEPGAQIPTLPERPRNPTCSWRLGAVGGWAGWGGWRWIIFHAILVHRRWVETGMPKMVACTTSSRTRQF